MMTFWKLVVGFAAAYLIVVVLMAVFQDWLLFPRWAVPSGAADLPASARRVTLNAASGERLVGVHLPADPRPRNEAALILGFGGNAWSAGVLASYLHSVFPDRDVIAVDYRGYGQSAGRPSAKALLQDALVIHDHLADTMAPERIVVVGLSIGAGPAAHLASRRSIAGLVLVTPFDSLSALARAHYPWAPVGLLFRHEMDVATAVAASAAPLALIAAERDAIVFAKRTEPLRKAGRNLVLDRVVIGAGHNDLYDRIEFMSAMRDALSLIEAGGANGPPNSDDSNRDGHLHR